MASVVVIYVCSELFFACFNFVGLPAMVCVGRCNTKNTGEDPKGYQYLDPMMLVTFV